MKSTLLSLVALAAFVYVCFCVYLYLMQRSFIYYPTPAAAGLPAEELWLDSDSERIRVWRLHAARPDAILYFGGNAEDVAFNIPEFSDWFPQHAIYLVNYRGYGGSSGSPSEAALSKDAEAIFEFVRDGHRNVALIGRSLGAAVAVGLAAKKSVERVALITPFDSLASLARDFYPIFPTSLLLKDKYDSLASAGRIRVPVLIIIAEHDEIIPYPSSERLADAISSPRTIRVVEGTGHNTVGASPDFGRTLQAFMAEGARGASPQ
jgi:pimeloyl-ACP methyl ester carboxylesterase